MELSWWSQSDRGRRHRGSLLCAALVGRCCGPASFLGAGGCLVVQQQFRGSVGWMVVLRKKRVVQGQTAGPRHRVCNVDIGIQQLRYWLPLGAELSSGRNCPLRTWCDLTTAPAKCSKTLQDAKRTQDWLTSGFPLPAAAGLLQLRGRHRWSRSSCQTLAADGQQAWWVSRCCWRSRWTA